MSEQQKNDVVEKIVNDPELLTEVLNTEQAQMVIVQQQEMSLYQGPLPRPQDVAEYAKTIPNFGDWIKDYAKSEQQSRHYGLKKSFSLKAEGTRYGFASLLALLGFAIYLVEKGYVGSAVTVLLGTLVAIVGLFVIGKKIETQPNKNE